MPKKDEISKTQRMLLVLRVVKSLGRASPEDVLRRIANTLDTDDQDENLKRKIYRDLKGFSETGELGVCFYTPDGRPIESGEEDDVRNKRVEYFIKDRHAAVPGAGLLEKCGVSFLPQRRPIIHWVIREASSGNSNNHLNFVFLGSDRMIYFLSSPVEELPVKLIIARKPGFREYFPSSNEIERNLGLRASLVLFPDNSISRPVSAKKLGHAIIETQKDISTIRVRDLGSTGGSYWCLPSHKKMMAKVIRQARKNMTIEIGEHLFEVSSHWEKVNFSDLLKTPVYLKFGGFTIFVSLADED